MKKITDSLINKARMLYEDIEDIPYAEQLPDEDSDGGMYEFGQRLYDKTQNILNTVGAKIMNNLTMIEVGANISKYKGVLSQLNVFKSELSQGMDRIYDYVEQAGYDSRDPNVKKLDSMYDQLDDDLIILGDIKDILDTMIFTAESLNRNHTKAFKLGIKNMSTDIAPREISENITDPIALVDFIIYQLDKLQSDSKFYSKGYVGTIKNRVEQLRTMI